MSNAARSSHKAPETAAAGSLLEAVHSLLGPVSIVDLGFPYARIPRCVGGEPIAMLAHPRAEMERDFLFRFRQAGGHAPILGFDPAAPEMIWPLQQADRENAKIVIALDDVSACCAHLNVWRELGAPLLILAQPKDDFAAGTEFERVVRLQDQRGGLDWLLLFPLDRRRARSASEPLSLSFDAGEQRMSIKAGALIHDGGHVSEGDASYSWLWTGPSTHFRIVIPQPCGIRPRRVELCAPRTEDAINLDRVAAHVDGRPTPHRVDRWSETSGKIIVEIPPGDDYIVLTLIIPAMTPDGNSGRLLGLCLDQVILVA